MSFIFLSLEKQGLNFAEFALTETSSEKINVNNHATEGSLFSSGAGVCVCVCVCVCSLGKNSLPNLLL